MQKRYKITVEYDGTGLLGWQLQLDGPSIQYYLERALHAFTGQEVEVSGAGRTDAGVHALRQVAHFDLDTKLDCYRIREAFNAHLREFDGQVSVLEVEEVDPHFHARYSAKGRVYRYRILNRKSPPTLLKNRVWWVPQKLDIKKMQKAAAYLIGNHDFSSFRAVKCQALSPIKTMDKIIIETLEDEIHIICKAKSFLHHQVRNIVGTLKLVGDGTLNPSDVKKILEAKDRTKAGPTSPAEGLYLEKIRY